ncbi:MAG: flagellin, partial [Planctomycetes bacterium]|nr:flagellin [Planctomycetota bacterium]
MALIIRTNVMATTAARHLGKAYNALAESVERLSSGLRINSAKDDAASMAVRELLRADIAVLKQGSRNALDGISMLQTMEAAMGIMDENLVRMKELAEQASTGSYSSAQRTIMDAEFAEMANEIERIAGATTFNGISMLNEAALSTGTNDIKIHVGDTTTIDVERVDMTQSGLNIETGDGGWQVTGKTASGVSATSVTYVTVLAGCDDAGTGVSLNISFEDNDASANDELNIVAVFTAVSIAGGTGFSLASVVSTINVASNNLGFDASGNDLRYSAAEAYYDSPSST